MNKVALYKGKIEEVAKEKEKENEEISDSEKYSRVGLVGAGINLSGAAGMNLGERIQPELSWDDVVSMSDEKSKDIGLPYKLKAKKVKKGQHAVIRMYSKNEIAVGGNEFIARHELGHVNDFYKKNKKLHDKRKTGVSYNDAIKTTDRLGALNDKADALRENIKSVKEQYQQALDDKDHKKAMKFLKEESKLSDMEKQNFKDSRKLIDEIDSNTGFANKKYRKENVVKGGSLALTSALHSKTVRDYIRDKNDGKSKIIDKAMSTLDNPYIASAGMGLINDGSLLRAEFAASNDALKDMVKKHGVKKGLRQALPMYIAQTGGYVGGTLLKEGAKGSYIRLAEDIVKKKAKENKAKKVKEKTETNKEA